MTPDEAATFEQVIEPNGEARVSVFMRQHFRARELVVISGGEETLLQSIVCAGVEQFATKTPVPSWIFAPSEHGITRLSLSEGAGEYSLGVVNKTDQPVLFKAHLLGQAS